jgi:hypothetical protein
VRVAPAVSAVVRLVGREAHALFPAHPRTRRGPSNVGRPGFGSEVYLRGRVELRVMAADRLQGLPGVTNAAV